MFEYILTDIYNMIPYTYKGIIVGFVAAVIWVILSRLATHKWDIYHGIIIMLLITYLVVISEVTFFSREPGSRTISNLRLLGTWGTTLRQHSFVIENVIMFLPMGIFLPILSKRLRNLNQIFFISLAISLGIELIQFMTERGFFQLDDVVMNVLGTIIGFIFWKIGNLFRKN